MSASLDEGAQAGDGFADDERVHLARSLVGVDGFGVGDKTADMVVEQNTPTQLQAKCSVGHSEGRAGRECLARTRDRRVR